MSNNIVTVEGLVSLETAIPLMSAGEHAWWGYIRSSNLPTSLHRVVFAGKAAEHVSNTVSKMGTRFWARVQGKLVSFPNQVYVLAKFVLPSVVITADEAERILEGNNYHDVAAVSLDGFIQDVYELRDGEDGPEAKTYIATDKAYNGGVHRVILVGKAARLYSELLEAEPGGSHAVVQGKLESRETIQVRAVYLRSLFK